LDVCWKTLKNIPHFPGIDTRLNQGCQISLVTTYQNGEKYT
jgi:hypothetical protein